MGSRQDLDFDGCAPLFWNRLVCCDFLRGYLDCPKSQNVLDKSLYTTLRCNEFAATTRVNTLWKYLLSEPWRWLAGKTAKLEGWSLIKMNWVAELVEDAFEQIVDEPSLIFDPNFNIFSAVAAELPAFADYQHEMLETVVSSPDGTKHKIVKLVLAQARTPDSGSGIEQATAMTLELAKTQAHP